jgi:hypothetical protein
LPDNLQLVNLLPLAEKRKGAGSDSSTVAQARQTNHGSGLFELFAKEVDDSLTWEFIPWLRTVTKLPIFVKVTKLNAEIQTWDASADIHIY